MIKFSIISTVYNQQEYIKECIESVQNQTYTNFEHIIVDDGSTDNSYNVCKEYAEKDSRIKVIHKENGGVSSARNVGLDNVTGDYVFFLDGDDFFHPELLQKCFEKALEKVDIIEFGRHHCDERGNILYSEKGKENCAYLKHEIGVLEYLLSNKCRVLISNRCFKYSIIKNNNIRFSLDIKYSEDYLFSLMVTIFSKIIVNINLEGYYYRKNSQSYSANILHKEQLISIIFCAFNFYCYIKNKNFKHLEKNFYKLFFYIVELDMIFGPRNFYWQIDKEIIKALTIKRNKFAAKMSKSYFKNKQKKSCGQTLENLWLDKRDDILRKYIATQNIVALKCRVFFLRIIRILTMIKRKLKILKNKRNERNE